MKKYLAMLLMGLVILLMAPIQAAVSFDDGQTFKEMPPGTQLMQSVDVFYNQPIAIMYIQQNADVYFMREIEIALKPVFAWSYATINLDAPVTRLWPMTNDLTCNYKDTGTVPKSSYSYRSPRDALRQS